MSVPHKNVAARTAWIDRPVKQQPRPHAKSEMPRNVPSRGEGLPTRTTPENGDIVVRAEMRGDTLVYVLHMLRVRTKTFFVTATKPSHKP